MSELSVEQLIRSYINLPSRPNPQGWYPVLCKVCNDHGKKGPRAAFKFDNGVVGYNCFNCGAKATHDPSQRFISKNLEKYLQDFGVPTEEIDKVRFHLFGKDQQSTKPKEKLVDREPAEINLPSHFYLVSYDQELNDDQKIWIEIATEYLKGRGISVDSYPFMLSTGKVPNLQQYPAEVQKAMFRDAYKWYGRLIVPIFKDNKLVFYTGRDMTGNATKKYESPSVAKNKVLFGFDQLFVDTDKPLYIVEGVFDAILLNGVAVFGNEISDTQQYWLNRSNRRKVYIPDRFGRGGVGAKQAIANGWEVSFPEIGSCKDINEGIIKYGKLYVLASIEQNTASSFEAELKVQMYCK